MTMEMTTYCITQEKQLFVKPCVPTYSQHTVSTPLTGGPFTPPNPPTIFHSLRVNMEWSLFSLFPPWPSNERAHSVSSLAHSCHISLPARTVWLTCSPGDVISIFYLFRARGHTRSWRQGWFCIRSSSNLLQSSKKIHADWLHSFWNLKESFIFGGTSLLWTRICHTYTLSLCKTSRIGLRRQKLAGECRETRHTRKTVQGSHNDQS